MTTRPLIAIVGQPLGAGRVRGWFRESVGVPTAFFDALDRAGADAAMLAPLPNADAARRLERFDGLLLIGGGDVDPARFGAAPTAELLGVDDARDAFEIALTRAAVDRGVPTLAVCRGAQVLNVALGGTLDQHITGRSDVDHGAPGVSQGAAHPVRVEAGSRVAEAMDCVEAECVSSHHQALASLGEGLAAVAWAPDGVIEAVEHSAGWVVGVQWHPERLAATDRAQQGLFSALARRAMGA